MLKWKLMLTTLPWVGGMLALKLVLELWVRFPGVIDFSDVGVVLTGGVFLIGFMLAGTMADYKESEKLPGELACALETLEELLAQATVLRPSLSAATLRGAVAELADGLIGWLHRRAEASSAFASLTRLQGVIQQVEREGGGAYASRALSELHNARKIVTRMSVISRTGFLPAGYALLDTLTGIVLVLLFLVRFKSTLSECILVPFVSLVYLYLVRLIRDVDDPFAYGPDGSRQGAEVDLLPLLEYRERLRGRASAPP